MAGPCRGMQFSTHKHLDRPGVNALPVMNPTDFFAQKYKALRPLQGGPMKWMERMFAETIQGKPRSLVDLPTGAGKTELGIFLSTRFSTCSAMGFI